MRHSLQASAGFYLRPRADTRVPEGGAVPSADVLSRMADLFGTTVDVMVNGHSPDKAQAALKNAELLKHFRQLEELPDDDLKMFVKLIGAYLRDHKAKQAYV